MEDSTKAAACTDLTELGCAGDFSGRVVRPLLGMHKDELVALCHHHGLPFAEDPTNRDTTFARNHLRELLSSSQDTAAHMSHEREKQPTSQRNISEQQRAQETARISTMESAARPAVEHTDVQDTRSSRNLSSSAHSRDVLRVMSVCGAASMKLQKEADLLLERARLPGSCTLLDTAVLSQGNKHVAVRALAKALLVG